MALPDLSQDIPYCLQRDLYRLVAELGKDGTVRIRPVE
jgi:phosphosulfolactate phosphohydrolase-like enzyme